VSRVEVQEQYSDLVRGLYSYAEADRIAGVSRGTSKRWLEGYRYRRARGVTHRPPVSDVAGQHGPGAVSFLDLVEVVMISGLRRWFSPHVIRQIVEDCEQVLGTRYPLASHRFETDGREIYLRRESVLVGLLGRKWETAWHELLQPFLHQLDYRDEFAARWYPLGRNAEVVIDPEYGFGLPVIKGTGIRTEIVAERFEHERDYEIADDLGVGVSQVQDALRFEIGRRKAA